jgi:hypothetical protein
MTIPDQASVPHTCNPNYSEGRDQEDHGMRPVRSNGSRDPILKMPNTKKGQWSGSSGKVLA